MSQTVGDFIVERMHAWGVRKVFGYPGDGINGVFGALKQLLARYFISLADQTRSRDRNGLAREQNRNTQPTPDQPSEVPRGFDAVAFIRGERVRGPRAALGQRRFEGLVTEILPDVRYRVQLDDGHQLVACTAGKNEKESLKD